MSTNSTPQIAQPHTIPSPSGGLNTPYDEEVPAEREEQARPGEQRRRRPDAADPGAVPHRDAAEQEQPERARADQRAAPSPSGQRCAETYGPPSAHAPPTSITARMPRYIERQAQRRDPPTPPTASRRRETSGSCRDAGRLIAAPLPSAAALGRDLATAGRPTSGRGSGASRPRAAPAPGSSSRGRGSVTAPSSSESTSTVTHHGVPISSWRRYSLPIAAVSSYTAIRSRLRSAEQAVAHLDDLGPLLEQRQHRDLVRRDVRVEAEDDALLAADLLLAIGVDEERERGPVGAGGGLDDPRDEVLARSPGRSTRGSRPIALAWLPRSKSPRLWIPSSSFQPNGKRYSTSIAFFA